MRVRPSNQRTEIAKILLWVSLQGVSCFVQGVAFLCILSCMQGQRLKHTSTNSSALASALFSLAPKKYFMDSLHGVSVYVYSSSMHGQRVDQTVKSVCLPHEFLRPPSPPLFSPTPPTLSPTPPPRPPSNGLPGAGDRCSSKLVLLAVLMLMPLPPRRLEI